MRKEFCGKMMKMPGMPEARPCIREKEHSSNKHTLDLKGLKNVFGYAEILRRAPNYVAPRGSEETRWWVLDKFGSKRMVGAHKLFNGNSRGRLPLTNSGLGSRDKKGKQRPEYKTVAAHYYWIVKSKEARLAAYKGMPFFDGWNPDKDGSCLNGMIWIIENLGKRPKGSSIHIIDHEKGFVPGNLEWASKRKQNNQQMFKIIAQQRHHIKELEAK